MNSQSFQKSFKEIKRGFYDPPKRTKYYLMSHKPSENEPL